MQGIPLNERKRLGALLDDRPQTKVMAMIPQFSQAETDNFVAPPAQIPEALGVLMFNMERGVNLPEIEYSEEAKKAEGKRSRLLEINKEAANPL